MYNENLPHADDGFIVAVVFDVAIELSSGPAAAVCNDNKRAAARRSVTLHVCRAIMSNIFYGHFVYNNINNTRRQL